MKKKLNDWKTKRNEYYITLSKKIKCLKIYNDINVFSPCYLNALPYIINNLNENDYSVTFDLFDNDGYIASYVIRKDEFYDSLTQFELQWDNSYFSQKI